MRQPLNARRTELRLPCDKPEPPRVVLEKLPARTKPRWVTGSEIALFVFVLLVAALELLRHR